MRLGTSNVDRAAVAKEAALQRKRAAGKAARAERDRLFHRDVARAMADAPRASADELKEVSALMNVAQRAIVPPWESPSWFKMFRKVDGDGSGLISYDEFVEMVRGDLQLSAKVMPQARLQALWLALDTDGSGYLSSGEVRAPDEAARPAPAPCGASLRLMLARACVARAVWRLHAAGRAGC